jgi:thiol peroxidase
MASTKLRGTPITIAGDLPKLGSTAPDFKLVATDLSEATLASFAGRKKVMNIFPSLDTGTCANSVRQFYRKLKDKGGVVCINVSMDLPFAHKRFCSAEGIDGVADLSGFRSPDFGKTWGVTMQEGNLAGLYARSVVVLDENNRVLHSELVADIANEPNYDAALAKL